MNETKKCTKCNEEKDIWQFSFRVKQKNTRRNECKKCQAKVVKEYYKKNKSIYYKRNKKRRDEIRNIIWGYKKDPCMDCKKIYHPCQMHFDHREDEEKNNDISRLANSLYLKQALEEIKKCDLVCANCHAMRTYNRLIKKTS